jgi:hypothetical protein
MQTFAPEFSKFWLAEPAKSQDSESSEDEANEHSAELQALADLVNAARSII